MRAAILIFLLTLLGCSGGTMGEQEYASAFKKSCEAYLAFGKELNERPLPDKAGMTKEQRMHTMAGLIREDYARLKSMADEYAKLKPPSKYKGLHEAYLEFLNGQYQRWMNYADAIETGDRKNMDLAGSEIDKFLISQFKLVIAEIEKTGAPVGDLKQKLDAFVKESSGG